MATSRNMAAGVVHVTRSGHILIMELDNVTKRNAFTVPMYHQLARALFELDQDISLRVGVICAKGDHFSAGLDLPQWVFHVCKPQNSCNIHGRLRE